MGQWSERVKALMHSWAGKTDGPLVRKGLDRPWILTLQVHKGFHTLQRSMSLQLLPETGSEDTSLPTRRPGKATVVLVFQSAPTTSLSPLTQLSGRSSILQAFTQSLLCLKCPLSSVVILLLLGL